MNNSSAHIPQAAKTSFRIRIPTDIGHNEWKLRLPTSLYRARLTILHFGFGIVKNSSLVLLIAWLIPLIFNSVKPPIPPAPCDRWARDGQLWIACGPPVTLNSTSWNPAYVEPTLEAGVVFSTSHDSAHLMAKTVVKSGIYASTIDPKFRPFKHWSPTQTQSPLTACSSRLVWPTGSDFDTAPFVHAVPTCRISPEFSFVPLGISSYSFKDSLTVLSVVSYSRSSVSLLRHSIDLFNITGRGDSLKLTWIGCVPLKSPEAASAVKMGLIGGRLSFIVASDRLVAMDRFNFDTELDSVGNQPSDDIEERVSLAEVVSQFYSLLHFVGYGGDELFSSMIRIAYGQFGIIFSYWNRFLHTFGIHTAFVNVYTEQSGRSVWPLTQSHSLLSVSPDVEVVDDTVFFIDESKNSVCSIDKDDETDIYCGGALSNGYPKALAYSRRHDRMFVLASTASFWAMEKCLALGRETCPFQWSILSLYADTLDFERVVYKNDGLDFGSPSSLRIVGETMFLGSRLSPSMAALKLKSFKDE